MYIESRYGVIYVCTYLHITSNYFLTKIIFIMHYQRKKEGSILKILKEEL